MLVNWLHSSGCDVTNTRCKKTIMLAKLVHLTVSPENTPLLTLMACKSFHCLELCGLKPTYLVYNIPIICSKTNLLWCNSDIMGSRRYTDNVFSIAQKPFSKLVSNTVCSKDQVLFARTD